MRNKGYNSLPDDTSIHELGNSMLLKENKFGVYNSEGRNIIKARHFIICLLIQRVPLTHRLIVYIASA